MNNQTNNGNTDLFMQNQFGFADQITELSDINIGATLRNYFAILSKWWWVILTIVVVSGALAFLFAKRVTPQYRAMTTIEVKQQETNILGAQVFEETDANDEFLITQLALLSSSKLAQTVVEDLGLQDRSSYAVQGGSRESRVVKAANVFRDKITVTRVRGSRIIAIAYEDADPEFAARATNKLAENFVKFNQERKYNATAYARDFVRDRLDTTKQGLEESERELYNYIQNAGILSDLNGATSGNSDNLDAEALKILSLDLVTAQSKRIEYENIYNLAKNDTFVTAATTDGMLNEMETLKSRLEIEYQEKSLYLKPKHPEMIALQTKITSLNERVNNRQNLSNDDVLDRLRAQFENAKTIENQYAERIAKLKREMINNQNADFDLTILQREVQTNRAQYDALLQRFKEITVSDGTGADLISIVDEAVVPKQPFSPNIPLIMTVAGFLSILASSLMVILANALDDIIRSPDDVKNKLNTMVLGTIPFAQDFKENMVEELKDPLSTVSEGYGSVRTALGMLIDSSEPTCLQITSTRAAEGKSSSAYAISKSFAESGRKVLLIDADMRKPGINANTNKGSSSIGLSGLLTTPAQLMDQIIRTSDDKINAETDKEALSKTNSYEGGVADNKVGFSVLPSGNIPTNPVALLSNIRFKNILEEAKAHFDIIVLDSPPVLGLADAILIGSLCHGTIVIVESNSIRTPQIQQALKRLRSGGVNVFGIVLSKYKRSADRYSDYYYYYSYSTEGYGGNESKKSSHKKLSWPNNKPAKKKKKLDILE